MIKYKQYLTEKLNESFNDDYETFYGDEIESEDADQAYKLAKKHEISVLSDKEIYAIMKINNEVAGALWTVFMSDEYSFDIVVADKYQGKGIAKELVDMAISDYEQTKEAFDDPIIRADVVNPIMKKILLQKGFEVESEVPNHVMMIRK